MKKQVLLLSVAVAALSGSRAFAQTDPVDDITTKLTAPVATATAASDGTAADILLDTGGGITVNIAGAAVTINSNNSFSGITGTTISNAGTADAVGILVDLTTQSLDSTNDGCTSDCAHTFEGITEAGIIDLSGSGDTKIGLWLQGPDPTTGDPANTFTGNIDMTGSSISITGDSSTGVKIDSLADLNGNLTLGTISLKPSTSTSKAGEIGFEMDGVVNGDIFASSTVNATGDTDSTSATIYGMKIVGTINGNLTIDAGSSIVAAGLGATGILISGNINACDQTVLPGCTSAGSFVNNGTISALGLTTPTGNLTGNPVSSFGLAIGGSIAGGFYNVGPAFDGDQTLSATISSQGAAPAIDIQPSFATTAAPIVIGVYAADVIDPSFSFYNRGNISSFSSNENDTTQAIFIGGDSTDTVTLTGGLFNAGTIQTSGVSQKGLSATATALAIGGYAEIGVTLDADGHVIAGDTYTNNNGVFTYNGTKVFLDDLHDEQAALVNSGEDKSGRIIAAVSGAGGGDAEAISIAAFANLPSIINSGIITAVATTTDPTIQALSAEAIVDASGTLNYIQNNGTIATLATTLNNGNQKSIAIDLSADGQGSVAGAGVMILDQATVDTSAKISAAIAIKFGVGDYQIVDVEGVGTSNTAEIDGDIMYGGGQLKGTDELIIGDFGTVTGRVTANDTQGVNVDVRSGGTLNLLNDSVALNAYNFLVEADGTLNIKVLEEFKTGIIDAITSATLELGAKLNITYGSFVGSTSDFILISAPHDPNDQFANLQIGDLGLYNDQLAAHLPFLFEDSVLELETTADKSRDELVLHVDPKDANELGLSGYAAQMLPFANQALANDDALGAAFVTGITDSKTAQLAYNEMAPDVSGGARAIAIALTDQSSGPVAARQRMLRMYGKQDGEVTLWGEEFAEFVQDPGDRTTGQTGFKDHGFGFVLGLDGGDPKTGWYGGAFSFYSGDIVEPLPRDSHTNTLWYMLTGYTDWRGRGLFLDTKVDLGYMDLKSKRFIDLTIPNASGSGSTAFQDEADSKRPGIVGALGMTTGAILAYGSTTFTPQLSIDGMAMREEGYTETHPGTSATGNGKGMDLQTQAYYANSLRAFIGTEIREDLNLGDFFVQPDVRLGYRYDFLNDPTKLKVNFADVGTNSTATPGPVFTLIGPDPAQGNFVAGASIAATTDAWTLGANFDFVRGTNGATTEVGTVHLLGRI